MRLSNTVRFLVGAALVVVSGCDRKNEGQDSAPTASARFEDSTSLPAKGNQPKAGPLVGASDDTAGTATPTDDRRSASASPLRRVGGSGLIAQISSSGRRGTLVNAWASWCGPCRREIPMLVAMRQNLLAQGIDVVFVSVDEDESTAAALSFAEEHGIEPPVLIAERPLGPFKQALNPRWPGMLPATFLFDGEGRLRYFWGGPAFENEILPVVEGFLAGKDIDGEARLGLAPGRDHRQDAGAPSEP